MKMENHLLKFAVRSMSVSKCKLCNWASNRM